MFTSNTLINIVPILGALGLISLVAFILWQPRQRDSSAFVVEKITYPFEYLEKLPFWDGKKRLDTWLATYLGEQQSEYSRKVGTAYLLGMVSRALDPGCRFDKLLLLIGGQGGGKSQALRTLAGDEWFSDVELDFSDKDSISALHGKWLHEIAEMGALCISEADALKSFITAGADQYRTPYSKTAVTKPRTIVFAGTTGDEKFLTGETNRRFWPVGCGKIDLVSLARDRDQLFAEALALYRLGARPDLSLIYQPAVQTRTPDAFADAIQGWAINQRTPFTARQVATDALNLEASKVSRDILTRIGVALRKLGAKRIEVRMNDRLAQCWLIAE